MSAILIVIVIVIVIIAAVAFNSISHQKHTGTIKESSHKLSGRKQVISPYCNDQISLYVKGIWAEKGRINEFRLLENEKIVDIRFEENNPYDKNALAVYSKRGIKLGYLPRNRRKLILTLRSNPNILAKIITHEEFYSKRKQRTVYSLKLLLSVGYNKEELAELEASTPQHNDSFIRFVNLSFQLRELKKEISSSKKADSQHDLKRMHELSLEILDHNENVGVDHRIKVPLDTLTRLTSMMKLHSRTIEFFEQFYDKADFTDKERERILTRVDQAKFQIDSQPRTFR